MKIQTKGVTAVTKAGTSNMKERIKSFYWRAATKQLDGVGVIEIILILVIIIGLVLIFRDQIGEIIEKAFATINEDVTGISDKIEIVE